MLELADWIEEELKDRGWKPADLARRGPVDSGLLSRILNGTRRAGPETCLAIARAFGVSPEKVYRLAGWLPSVPPAVEEEREALGILRGLPAAVRRTVLAMLRGLARQENVVPAGVGEEDISYSIPYHEDALVPEMLAEFEQVPEEHKELAIAQVAQFKRMATQPKMRIVGDEEEDEAERRTEEEDA